VENDKIKYNTTIYKTINKYKYPSPDLIIKHLTQYRPGDKFIIKGKLCYRTGRMAGIYRLDSSGAWSRQSMLSSSSQLRSARSSLSSRISHYLPSTIHGGSARSSITSPWCAATPISTRSNSPNNGPVRIQSTDSTAQHGSNVANCCKFQKMARIR